MTLQTQSQEHATVTGRLADYLAKLGGRAR